MRRTSIRTLFLLFVGILINVLSMEITLQQSNGIYYSSLDVTTNGVLTSNKVLIDSGNPLSLFVKETNSSFYNLSNPGLPCFQLFEDGSIVNLLSVKESNSQISQCPSNTGTIDLGSLSIIENYTSFNTFQPQNDKLHNWTELSGDMGLSYCGRGSQCKLSLFQQFILSAGTTYSDTQLYDNITYFNTFINTTNPVLFGLDFNNNTLPSTMQLGEIKSTYVSNMIWSPLYDNTPEYHMITIEDLSICSIHLFANWSTTWPALIDTGSVCLSLPSEIYDSLLAWIDITQVDTLDDLPSLSFQLNGYLNTNTYSTTNNQFYIPLKNLILDNTTSVYNSDKSATIATTINGISYHICIVRSTSITGKDPEKLNTPKIILGTKVLQSMYFAGDYKSGTVGLANKLTPSEIQTIQLNNQQKKHCQAKKACKGDQKYVYNYNKCTTPSCSHYFYVDLDEDTQTCRFSDAALGFGFFFIIIILIIEISSFFIIQRTTYDFLMNMDENDNGNTNNHPTNPTERGNIRNHRYSIQFDPITIFIGGILNRVVDRILIYMFGQRRRRVYRED